MALATVHRLPSTVNQYKIMAKKLQNIQLEGLSDLDFKKSPDIDAAQSVIEQPPTAPPQEEPDTKPRKAPAEKTARTSPKRETAAPPPPTPRSARSTFPPEAKKRATFNIDEDLHKALKDYSYFEEIEMVEYIFEHLVKPDLAKKGYYPPKNRKI